MMPLLLLAALLGAEPAAVAPIRLRAIDTASAEFPTAGDFVRILERFPLYAERGWHQGYRDNPELGWFGDGRSDENGQRTLANFVLAYSFLATRPDYDREVSGVPRQTVHDHALAALRYILHTHVTGELPCTDDKPWGDHWQSAWWTSKMLGGADLLWDELTADDKRRLEALVVHEADRHIGLPPRVNEYGDTKAEENAWDSEVLAWALCLYPTHPNQLKWREAFYTLCLNTLSVESDLQDTSRFAGRPINEWIGGPCVHPDFTIENHGYFHICYMSCPLHSLAWDYYVFRRFGQEPPKAIYHHTREVWERLKQFALWDGRFAYVGGKDWPRYAYGLYFMLPALVWFEQTFDDADARLIERQRVATFEREQRIWRDGSFFSGRFTHLQMNRWPAEWETDAAANLAIAALVHRFEPPPKPTAVADLARRNEGTWVSAWSELTLQRDRQRFAAWCWKPRQAPATGLICSDQGEHELEWDGSLCGEIAFTDAKPHVEVQGHHETTFAGGYTTTGAIGRGTVAGPPSPYRLVVQDTNLRTGEIVAADHPLFTTPFKIESLSSLTDLDSITEAGPGWQVLARNVKGGPSILEATIGAGRIIVSMTNVEERCAGGEDTVAEALMDNLLAYVGARQKRCGYIRGEAHLAHALDYLGLKVAVLPVRGRLDLTGFDVIFIDRTANSVRSHYRELLEFCRRGGVVFKSIIQDTGWSPDTIADAAPLAVRQALSWSVLPDGHTAVLIGSWTAAADVTPSTVDLLHWPVANDVFNGLRRTFHSADPDRPELIVPGVPDETATFPLASRWLCLEQDLGCVVVGPDLALSVSALAGRPVPQKSLGVSLVRLAPARATRKYAKGEVVARFAVVFRTRAGARTTAALAGMLPDAALKWQGDRARLRVPGADGKWYELDSDLGAGLTTTVR